MSSDVRASEICLNKLFTFTFKEAPFLQANRKDHVDDQTEQIVFFLVFPFVYNCDIKVLNGKYVNSHVIG